MKGLILAGGNGTRLAPTTKVINKHLLPIYDKPMIYYSLSNLMVAGCEEIIVLSTPNGVEQIKSILNNGSNLGIKIEYIIQETATGIPSAIYECAKLLESDEFWVNLGDNFIFGSLIQNIYEKASKDKNCCVFLKEVSDVSELGCAVFSENKLVGFQEKPKVKSKGFAVTGLYKFNNKFFEYYKNLKISDRGETEIVDILTQYLKENYLTYYTFGRGVSWIDAGTINDLIKISNFVHTFQEINSNLICSPEEIAFNRNLISKESLLNTVQKNYPNTEYGEKLTDLFN